MDEAVWGSTPVLLCIDMQIGILDGRAGPRQDEADAALLSMYERVARLQARSRELGRPVVHVRHDGSRGHRLEPMTPGWPIHPLVAPFEAGLVLSKRHCDAFHGTNLPRILADLGATTLVVAGCMTQFCIDTTCRRAISEGFDVVLVSDGHMNGGSGPLGFEEVIAHHNRSLDGLDAGGACLRLATSAEILDADA